MSGAFTPPEKERGAALLTVLLLVTITGALAAAAFDKLLLSQRLAANFAGLEQARNFSTGIESLALLTIDDMTARSRQLTTLAGNWNGATRQIPLPGGIGTGAVTIRDGGNCFNLNSVVQGGNGAPTAARPLGMAQFAGLMGAIGIPSSQAQSSAAAAADWADNDTTPVSGGAEDADYLRRARPHRTANAPFAEASELRAVAGMTPELYARLRPWLCALPTTDLSPINVNTLSLEQAPLLAMLAPEQLGVERARRVLSTRPPNGWRTPMDFWRIEAMSELDLASEAQMQVQLRTQWFALEIATTVAGSEVIETALVDARNQPSRVAIRRWGADE